MLKKTILLFILMLISQQSFADENYAEQLRRQIKRIESNPTPNFSRDYFHDMSIIARKADEADLTELTSEIVLGRLFKLMDEFISEEFKAIDELYQTDPIAATKRLEELIRYVRGFEPSDEFLNTAAGKAIDQDMTRLRTLSIEEMKSSCSESSIIRGIQAVRKTGLFVTRRGKDGQDLQTLINEINCCLSWNPVVHFADQIPFKTDYEEGFITEEASLNLRSDRRNFNEAEWAGEWIRRFDGRDGIGEAVSPATLKYRKGNDTAQLIIATSKVGSSGRINFPISLVGQERTLEMESQGILPFAYYGEDKRTAFAGCKHEKK